MQPVDACCSELVCEGAGTAQTVKTLTETAVEKNIVSAGQTKSVVGSSADWSMNRANSSSGSSQNAEGQSLGSVSSATRETVTKDIQDENIQPTNVLIPTMQCTSVCFLSYLFPKFFMFLQ